MSLRTKILISICAVMVVVLLLLTLNLWADMAVRAQREMHRNAEFLGRLVVDWVREEASLRETFPAMNWANVSRKIARSTLVSGWVIAGHDETGLKVYCSSSPDRGAILRMEGQHLSDVLVQKRTIVRGSRVYTRLETPTGIKLAARFDLESAAVTAIDLSKMMTGVLWIMGLGTLLLLIVTYVLVNRFVLRPLGSLVEASERVARGDFENPIRESSGYDEMARMINAFNLMMRKIAEYHGTMEKDVRVARKRVRETEKSLFAAQRLSTTGTLAAGIAHEINNPLGGMINAVHALRGSGLDKEKRKEYISLIDEGLLRVRDIVAKVLRFSPKSLEPTPVRPTEMVERAVAFLEHRIRDRGVKIRVEFDDEIPLTRGDALEIQQAFLNILMNSVDAVDSGRGEVEVSARREGKDAVRIVFRDNGCGMSEEEVRRCLDPFYTTKEVGKGTGLGLSVAHNIISNHGGRLEISSTKGEGTVVSVVFPAMTTGKVESKS